MQQYNTIFPRPQLKQTAKEKLRGHWKMILLITLLTFIVVGVFVGHDIPDYIQSMNYMSGSANDLNYYIQSQEAAATSPWEIGISLLSGILYAIIGFAYIGWFVKLNNKRDDEAIGFNEFVEGFGKAFLAIRAYLWKMLWIFIWSIPASLVAGVGIVMFVFSIATGSSAGDSLGLGIGLTILVIVLTIAAAIITLRYTFMEYVLNDAARPIGAIESMRYSIAIIKGHLGDLILLLLSFIPWFILSTVLFFIPFFYVIPYVTMTMVQAYIWMRDDAFESGRLNPELLGFRRRETVEEVYTATPIATAPVVTPAPNEATTPAPETANTPSAEAPIEPSKDE